MRTLWVSLATSAVELSHSQLNPCWQSVPICDEGPHNILKSIGSLEFSICCHAGAFWFVPTCAFAVREKTTAAIIIIRRTAALHNFIVNLPKDTVDTLRSAIV